MTLDVTGRQADQAPAAPEPERVTRMAVRPELPPRHAPAARIERFDRTERAYHWVQAVPYMVCLVSGALLLLATVGGPLAGADWKETASLTHRVAGVSMVVGILLVCLAGKRRGLVENVRCAFTWRRDDFRWLAIMPLHALGFDVRLPPVGKFNAGQKLNLLAQLVLVPVFALSGAVMWFVNGALLAWYAHVASFVIVTPLVCAHFYLALLHPSTRRGLRGVLDGTVDRAWAEEHYPAWVAEADRRERAAEVEAAAVRWLQRLDEAAEDATG